MRSQIASVTLLALLGVVVSGCDDVSNEPEQIEAPAYVDGAIRLTDEGAFAVELWNKDGAAVVGANTFVLRVCMADTDQGIPGAEIDFSASMPDAEVAGAESPTVTYLGDGQYQVSDLVLEREGTWEFDVAIAVGDSLDESVTFAFQLAE